MLRPGNYDDYLGRLDKLFYVPLPDEQSRVEILKTVTKLMPIYDGIDFERFAKQTKGSVQELYRFSGADLACLAREAALSALEDIKLYDKDVKMSNVHFERALAKTKPSVCQEDLKLYCGLNNPQRF